MQQYLPFTVLKLADIAELCQLLNKKLQQYLPFTVLKLNMWFREIRNDYVATVLTVYGIETISIHLLDTRNHLVLQQYLPFTVLKHIEYCAMFSNMMPKKVATVLTVYGIETIILLHE